MSYDFDMAPSPEKNISSLPVIDVEKTSRLLKSVRQKNGIRVSQVQKVFGMENPQSIYVWEDPSKKILPRLDNMLVLSRLYATTIDQLLVLKMQ